MLFWIVAALLTVGACMSVLLPFARAVSTRDEGASRDIEVYKDQLDEVERDAKRGLIAPTEAEQARIEIGRRILKADAQIGKVARRGSGGRFVAMAAILSIPLVSWGVYAATGSPEMPSQPLKARLQGDPADSSVESLVARAEAHLRTSPEDGRGWDLLAPIYLRMGRVQDSEIAYRNAIRLLGADAKREAGAGEALVAVNGGVITTEAEAAFERALAHAPDDGKARFFLGLADAQAGRQDEARARWTAMVADLPADSPWRSVAQNALDGRAESVGSPDEDAIAAAEGMSREDRGAMIEGMVASLDARLKENPQDVEGWQRLVRSYLVLEDPNAARDALARGMAALGNTTRAAAELQTFSRELGVTAGQP